MPADSLSLLSESVSDPLLTIPSAESTRLQEVSLPTLQMSDKTLKVALSA